MAKYFDLTPFDESYMLYGNYIGVVYVLETSLDAHKELKKAKRQTRIYDIFKTANYSL